MTDREKLVELLCRAHHNASCVLGYDGSEVDALEEEARYLLANGVVVREKGEWEDVTNPQWPAYSHDKCNICGWWNTKNAMCYDGKPKRGHSLNFCPNCGADMRKGESG